MQSDLLTILALKSEAWRYCRRLESLIFPLTNFATFSPPYHWNFSRQLELTYMSRWLTAAVGFVIFMFSWRFSLFCNKFFFLFLLTTCSRDDYYFMYDKLEIKCINNLEIGCSWLSCDAGERLVSGFWREIQEANHLTELDWVSFVDCVSNVRQLTTDLSRSATQANVQNNLISQSVNQSIKQSLIIFFVFFFCLLGFFALNGYIHILFILFYSNRNVN